MDTFTYLIPFTDALGDAQSERQTYPSQKKNADISKEKQGTRDSYSVARFQLLILATRVNGRNIRDSYTSQKRGNRQYVNTRFQLLF